MSNSTVKQERIGVAVTTGAIAAFQVRRLRRTTSSRLDRPTPIPFYVGTNAILEGLYKVQDRTANAQLPSADQMKNAAWLISTPHSVRVGEDSTSIYLSKDGSKRYLIVPPSFFSKTEAEQREAYRAAKEHSRVLPRLAVTLTGMAIERAIWTRMVGDREALSTRRAVAFVAIEQARAFTARVALKKLDHALDMAADRRG